MRKVILLVFLILIILLINLFLRNSMFFVTSGIQKFFWSKGSVFQNTIDRILNIKTILKQNSEHYKENIVLKKKIAEMEIVQEQNKELRNIVDLGLNKENELCFADVITRDILSSNILINKGIENGVVENMVAITSDGLLVGRIKKAYKSFAQVELINNNDFSYSVDINGITASISSHIVDLLPKDIDFKKGDLITTSNLGGIFPHGILIGEVKEIITNDAWPFYKARAELFFEKQVLKHLFIIK